MTDNYDPAIDKIAWHVYGRDGVMGALEPDRNDIKSHELCVLAEILSSDQKRAMWIGNRCRVALLHTPYPGQVRGPVLVW